MLKHQLDRIMMITCCVETLAEKLKEEKKKAALVCLRQIRSEVDNLITQLER